MTQTKAPEPVTAGKPISGLDRYFGLTAHGSNIPRELRAGFTTWLTMSYILFVNPQVLSSAIDVPNAFNQLLTTTCLAAAFGSLAMGIVARYPFAQAPGMGLNAFFAYSVVGAMGYTWQTALGAVFISGVLFVVLSVAGARQAIVKAIPLSLKFAITAGIGAFLAFLGFKSAGIVVANEATLVGLGSLTQPIAWLAIIGLLGTAVLMYKKVKGAILYGIIGLPVWPTDLIGQLDIGAALGLGLFSVVFTFFFVDFFDATGTLTGLAQRAGYLDAKGDMPRARLTFSMDGLAAMFGAFVGTSTTTAYVESASGIEEGGKTGITASTVGVLFILSTFLWPIAGVVPGAATAPALILVGALMMQAAKDIDWVDLSEGVPAFLTVILMPLTFSIANGVSFGVIAYCAIKLLSGEGKKVSPILYVVALLLIARYVFLAEG